jgi:RNA polymerase sigma-70 factor, ECF subfamily
VFVKAWETLPRYPSGHYPFMIWLYHIADTLISDTYRHNQELEVKLQDDLFSQQGSSIEEQTAPQYSIALLLTALKRLTNEEQQVIILRFIEGLSHQDVAQMIGKTEAASRIIQYRALLSLQKVMKNEP